jgi:hypothetical protein
MKILQEQRLICEVLHDVDAVIGCRDALAQLAEIPGATTSIIQHPDWLLFELKERMGRISPHVIVIRNAQDRIIGYAFFLAGPYSTRIALGKHFFSLYKGRTLRMLGPNVVALRHEFHVAEAAVAEALACDRSVQVVQIQETVIPNTFGDAVSKTRHPFTCVSINMLDQLNWIIRPYQSLQAYLDSLGARRKKLAYALRNVYKKLGEKAYLRVFETPEDMDHYAELMNSVYARSWHATEKHVDWASSARRALFIQLAGNQQLVGHIMLLGQRPIAYVHGYRLGGRYVLDDTGYDEDFASLGIGSALVFQAVQDLISRHPGEVIDFGYGDNHYKRVLASEQQSCGSLYLVRGVRARICFSLVSPLRWVYRQLHKLRVRRLKGSTP